MTWDRPQPVLTWDPDSWLGKGHRTIYNSWLNRGAWPKFPLLDGKCRVKEFTIGKGRRKVTDDFGPGSLHLVLDNSDGILDPAASGSPVAGETVSIPVCLAMEWRGGTYPIFTGVVDGPFRPQYTQGRDRVVEVDVSDWYGYSARIEDPGNPAIMQRGFWGGNTQKELIWWRGPMDASTATGPINAWIWDFGTSGKDGRVTQGSAPGYVHAKAPMPNMNLPAFLPDPAHVYGPSEYTAPADGITNVHLVFYQEWPTGTNASICNWEIGTRTAPLGNYHWRLYKPNDGLNPIKLDILSAGGTVLTTITAHGTFSERGPYQVVVIINRTLKIAQIKTIFGTKAGTWSGTSATLGGRVYMTASRTHFSEVAIGGFDGSAGVVAIDGTHAAAMWRGSTAPLDQDMPPFVPRTSSMQQWIGQPGGEMSRITTFTPQQALLTAYANAYGGTVWCQRDGRIRMSARGDLGYWGTRSSTRVEDDVVDVVAQLTDSPTASPSWTHPVSGRTYTFPVVRYSGPGHTGPDPERVANWLTVEGFEPFKLAEASYVDVPSVKRLGPRRQGIAKGATDIAWSGSPVSDTANGFLAARSSSTDAMRDVVIQPYGDDQATEFVLEHLELDARVLVTQSDSVTAVPLLRDVRMRVQSESWSWSRGGTDWAVTLGLDVPVEEAA